MCQVINVVQFSVVSDSLRPCGLPHARLPCPSPSPGACSNSCPLSQWCHSTISSSVVPFSSCLQSFPASGSFLMSQLFTSDGQSIKASASVLSMNIQGWFLLGLTGLISLQPKALYRVFSNTTGLEKQSYGGHKQNLVLIRTYKRLNQTCLWVPRSLWQRCGSTVACCRVRGTEYNSPGSCGLMA